MARPYQQRKRRRGTGTTLREQQRNPRATAENPSAGTPADSRRVWSLRDRALAVMHQLGEYHCTNCFDTGLVDDDGDDCSGWWPCGCHPITTREARTYLARPDVAAFMTGARLR